jgi:hypothetical protein
MGAAAVFETAAETPPTVGQVSIVFRVGPTAAQDPEAASATRVQHADGDGGMRDSRTQEVDHEGL